MRQFRNADEIGLRYVELGESRGAIRALDLVAMEGESCAACGGGPSTERSRPEVRQPDQGRANHWHRVCASCDRPWEPGARRAVLRHEVEVPPRPDAIEARAVRFLDEWLLIRRVVEVRPHRLTVERRSLTLTQSAWDFAVISWLIYLSGDVGSIARATTVGLEAYPELGDAWRPGRVRLAISTAQQVVEARAVRERLISPRAAMIGG